MLYEFLITIFKNNDGNNFITLDIAAQENPLLEGNNLKYIKDN